MSRKNFLNLSLFFILSFLSFYLLVSLEKGAVLQISLSKNISNTDPQIYFKESFEQPYSEKNSIKGIRKRKGEYIFPLKDIHKIRYLRLDPSDAKTDITLSRIAVVEKGWFHKIYYILQLQNLKALHQISNMQFKGGTLTFKATGNDPYLEMPFILKNPKNFKSLHIYELLLSFLIAFGGVFLFYLYKNYEHTQAFYAKLILYTLFFTFTLFKVNYYKEHIHFSYPPDEFAHLSYIEYVHNHHHFLPNYQEMKMVNNRDAYNYLSHPPLYYEIMNLAYDTSKTIKENMGNFRSLSSLIFILTFFLTLFIGFRAKLSPVADFVYLSVITAIPMHAYIGASISNDTLAMFGAILFILGFLKIVEKEYRFSNYALLSLGVLIAYFSKLTAALLIFFALLFYLLLAAKEKEWPKIGKREIVLFTLILIPILYYQFSIMYEYHAIVPTFNKTHPQEYMHSAFYIEPKYRQHLNISEWFQRLVGYIQGGWFGIHSHHSFTKESWFGVFGLVVLHIFALIALVLKCPKSESAFCRLGKITLLALFAVLVIQFFFSYRAHLNSGYMGGLQPRYLLPFMFAFAIMASLFVERFKNNFVAVVLVILLCIHALYSDFFYFLQYYQ